MQRRYERSCAWYDCSQRHSSPARGVCHRWPLSIAYHPNLRNDIHAASTSVVSVSVRFRVRTVRLAAPNGATHSLSKIRRTGGSLTPLKPNRPNQRNLYVGHKYGSNKATTFFIFIFAFGRKPVTCHSIETANTTQTTRQRLQRGSRSGSLGGVGIIVIRSPLPERLGPADGLLEGRWP
jgi:hypothetical protein